VTSCPQAGTELRKKMGEYLDAANNADEFDDGHRHESQELGVDC
jgi:hypothetical protein